MENKFEVGDIVICVDRTGYSWLTEGRKYETKYCSDVEIAIINDNGKRFKYPKSCFMNLPSIPTKEQEPNYMRFWDDNESQALELVFVADLSNNPSFNLDSCYIAIGTSGDVEGFCHCKSIEQWEADNKPKYRPFTMEEFKVYRDCWFLKKANGLNVRPIGFNDLGASFMGHCGSYQSLLDEYTFEDGTPCGIKE